MTGFHTGGPQGPPPTSPSEKSESGGGGAGVDLDRLWLAAMRATKGARKWSAEGLVDKQLLNEDGIIIADPIWANPQDEDFLVACDADAVLALVERVKALEAVAEAARELARADAECERDFTDESEKAHDNAVDAVVAAVAALAAAGGGDRHE